MVGGGRVEGELLVDGGVGAGVVGDVRGDVEAEVGVGRGGWGGDGVVGLRISVGGWWSGVMKWNELKWMKMKLERNGNGYEIDIKWNELK